MYGKESFFFLFTLWCSFSLPLFLSPHSQFFLGHICAEMECSSDQFRETCRNLPLLWDHSPSQWIDLRIHFPVHARSLCPPSSCPKSFLSSLLRACHLCICDRTPSEHAHPRLPSCCARFSLNISISQRLCEPANQNATLNFYSGGASRAVCFSPPSPPAVGMAVPLFSSYLRYLVMHLRSIHVSTSHFFLGFFCSGLMICLLPPLRWVWSSRLFLDCIRRPNARRRCLFSP